MASSSKLRAVRRCAAVVLGAAVTAGGIPFLVASGSGAASTSISVLQSRANAIGARETTIQTKLEILSEEYDEALTRTNGLATASSRASAEFKAAAARVAADTARLHTDAVNAYVDAGASAGLGESFSASASSLPVQQTYIAAASGSLDSAIASLQNAELTLAARKASLEHTEAEARANTNALAVARESASALSGQLASEEAGVKGSLEAAVARVVAEEQARAAARAAARAEAQAAAQAAAAAGGSTSGTITAIGTGSGSGAGAAAVAAARTQIGVPYVWAGASPSEGFDCSGLTMWAWAAAGVNLPHSAQGQYDSIEHISESELEPGDLAFYADGGYIYHVVMYIGGGMMIQAEDSGTRISISPLEGGAYGFGRP